MLRYLLYLVNATRFIPFLLLSFSTPTFSQSPERHCVIIADASNKSAISYATAVCCNYTVGVYGDSLGRICFDMIPRIDSIQISALGYQTKVFFRKTFLNADTIFLINTPISLKEVQVKTNRKSSKVISAGNTKSFKIQLRTDVLTPNSNTKLAVFIPNKAQQPAFIHELHYQLSPRASDIASSFSVRLRVYSNSARNLPSQDLLLENVIEKVTPEQKWITADISQHRVPFLAEGVWVGIESIGYTDLSGQYHPLSDFEYGKAIRKKGKIKGTLSVSPSYQYEKGEPQTSAEAHWKLKWQYITVTPRMVLKFGLTAIE